MAAIELGNSDETVLIKGTLQVNTEAKLPDGSVTGLNRSDFTQDNNKLYGLPLESWKVHDDMDSPLPSTPLTDDLGIIGGTFGTDSPSIQTEDLKAAGATSSYMRRTFVLPPEYVDGQSVTLRLHAGMLTTVADTSATIDVEVYESDEEAGIGSDICATAAQSINNLSLADKDFTITATDLVAGDTLDIRVTVAVNDGGSGTVVKAIIGAVKMLLDIKG